MEKIRLLDEIDSSKDLLSIPDTLVKILDAVSSDETSQDDIASIILRDPSLTAKVLKMANSSYYSRSGAIKTVHQGIRILGANAIKCIALSVSVFMPPKAKGAIDAATIRQFYFHCIGVSLLARKIAEELQMKNTEEVFIAGLLHDIGKLYMMNAHPVEYMKVKALTESGVDIIEAERRFFDVDHSELGSVMAARWKLPPDLQRVMRGHHHMEIDPELERTTAIVRLADVLAHNIQTPNLKTMERNREVFSNFEQALKLKREFLDSLAFLLLDETIAVAGSFGIDVGDTTELLNRANRELCKSYLMIEGLFKERHELSAKLLEEERLAGMLRSKNIAIATLSHYLNNVATAISGRVQLMQLALQRQQISDKSGQMTASLRIIEQSILKLLAVLAELKSLSRFDDQDFYNDSDALNIDERIKERLAALGRSTVNA